MKNNKYFRPDPLDIRDYFSDDTDYNTNAPSYYKALARFTHSLKILTERLNDVEGRVIDLFLEWLRDGVIEEIINVNIFTDLNNRLNQIRQDFDDHVENDFNTLLNNFNALFQAFTTFKNDTENNIRILNEDLQILEDNLIQLRNEFNSLKIKVDKHVPLNHYYSENFNTLQEALNRAKGGVLHIKPDHYSIHTPLKLHSNTIIKAYGSTFKRVADINNMFINDSNGVTGGFNTSKNIHFYGGTLDGNGGVYSDNCTMLAFGHAHNIKIIDVTFINLFNWHMVELNAVRNGLIENCIFSDYGTSTMGTEMVQIDIARGTAQFPWFGPYDNTTCESITIKNNVFTNGVRGIGTHSSSAGTEHHRIYIYDNEFYNMSGEAVYGLDWAFTKIHNNHFRNVQKGVLLRVSGRNVYNHSIIDNYLSGKDNGNSRAIQISGVKDGFEINGGTIKGNRIKRFGGHGVGVDHCSTWIVSENDITSCGKAGIIIYGSDHVTVNNNVSRLNNLSNESNYSISCSAEATKVMVNGNILDDFRSTSTCDQVFVTGNHVNSSVTVGGTNSQSSNNMVGGSIT